MWNEKQKKTAHKLHRQSELIHNQKKPQRRADQERWQQNGGPWLPMFGTDMAHEEEGLVLQ